MGRWLQAAVLTVGTLCLGSAGCGTAGPGASQPSVPSVGTPGRTTTAATKRSDTAASPAADVPSDPAHDPAPPRVAIQDSSCGATVGQRLLDVVNEERARHGLASLRPHPELVDAARAHADDQAARGTVTHVGSDGSAGSERVTRSGYSWASTGENVAGGYDDPAEVVEAWLDSPPHRAILLEPEAVHAGVGFTQASQDGFHWFWALTVAAPSEVEDTPAVRCHP